MTCDYCKVRAGKTFELQGKFTTGSIFNRTLVRQEICICNNCARVMSAAITELVQPSLPYPQIKMIPCILEEEK